MIPEEELLSLADVLIDEEPPIVLEDLEEEKITKELIEALRVFYEEPPESGEEAQHAGSSQVYKTHHHPYPLHYAASTGDVESMKKLVHAGHQVDLKDSKSATPLAVASIFGHTEAVHFLLQKGATASNKCYEGHTALHLALDKAHYDVAQLLVKEGKANPNEQSWRHISPMTMAFTKLENAVETLGKEKTNTRNQEINDLVTTLKVFAEYSPEYAYITLFHPKTGDFQIPLSCALKTIANIAPDHNTFALINEFAENTGVKNTLEMPYLKAKNLLSTFPTGKSYEVEKIKMPTGETFKITVDFYYKQFATELAKDSLSNFTQKLATEKENNMEIEIFHKVQESFSKACTSVTKGGQMQTAEMAFADYQAGKTVLLPSGWTSHFIDVFLSKKQGILATANSGERYHFDPAGIILYRLGDTSKIDEKVIHKILNNDNKMNLEFYLQYEIGQVSPLKTLNMPDQKYGNCNWESHRDAVKGMLYIELLNKGLATTAAEAKAQQYFQEWDTFHGKYVLEDYLSHSPVLPVKALGEIYLEIQKKKDTQNYTEQDSFHAKLIGQALEAPENAKSFQAWHKTLSSKEADTLETGLHPVESDHASMHKPAEIEKPTSFWSQYNPIKLLAGAINSLSQELPEKTAVTMHECIDTAQPLLPEIETKTTDSF